MDQETLFTTLSRITRDHAADLKADPTLAACLDADPAARETQVARLIDLQKRYDIVTTQNLYLPPSQRYETIDRVTFDGDPESRYHIVGRGATAAESVRDLLDQMAEVAANE